MLYKECASPALMKIHNVANFVNKCKHSLFHECQYDHRETPSESCLRIICASVFLSF